MGSVGSLVEGPDVSPTKTNRAVPQVRPKQANGLLKKGFNQRELLNYLNITRSVLWRSPLSNLILAQLACFVSQQKRAEEPKQQRGSPWPQLGRHTEGGQLVRKDLQ